MSMKAALCIDDVNEMKHFRMSSKDNDTSLYKRTPKGTKKKKFPVSKF